MRIPWIPLEPGILSVGTKIVALVLKRSVVHAVKRDVAYVVPVIGFNRIIFQRVWLIRFLVGTLVMIILRRAVATTWETSSPSSMASVNYIMI